MSRRNNSILQQEGKVSQVVGIGEAFVEDVVVESRVADEAVFVDSVGLASCVVAEDGEVNTYVLLGMTSEESFCDGYFWVNRIRSRNRVCK